MTRIEKGDIISNEAIEAMNEAAEAAEKLSIALTKVNQCMADLGAVKINDPKLLGTENTSPERMRGDA